MKITINEPCHENWDTMTPNTQGAFCKSCMKDVVDFSKLGVNEIKSFLSKPQEGKICGRFEEKQLQELNFDDFFSRFTYWNFTKKFAAIFFLAFGFWVFSNSSAMAQNPAHLKGEVVMMPDKTPKKDSTKKNHPENIKMGKIKCETPPPTPVKKREKPMIMGDIAAPVQEKPIPKKKED